MLKKTKKILFLSSHLYFSKKKISFHHLADSAIKNDYDVTFLTVPNSLLSFIGDKHNYLTRLRSVFYSFIIFTHNKLKVSSYFSFLHQTPKLNLGKINNFFFRIGYSCGLNYKYDILIFDSNVSLFLFDYLKVKNPYSKFIYRVSDDLVMLKQTSFLINKESELINRFDLISTPSDNLTTKLSKRNKIFTKIKTHYHGINRSLFDKKYQNPFNNSYVNLIFVGVGVIDEFFISFIKSLKKENYFFHFIGPISNEFSSKNTFFYGELKFEETLAFIKFADIGIQIRNFTEGIEVLEKSLKIIQYSYCKLPIISPKYLRLKGPNNFSYNQNYKSIKSAIKKALNLNRSNYDNTWVKDWDTVLENILDDA